MTIKSLPADAPPALKHSVLKTHPERGVGSNGDLCAEVDVTMGVANQ